MKDDHHSQQFLRGAFTVVGLFFVSCSAVAWLSTERLQATSTNLAFTDQQDWSCAACTRKTYWNFQGVRSYEGVGVLSDQSCKSTCANSQSCDAWLIDPISENCYMFSLSPFGMKTRSCINAPGMQWYGDVKVDASLKQQGIKDTTSCGEDSASFCDTSVKGDVGAIGNCKYSSDFVGGVASQKCQCGYNCVGFQEGVVWGKCQEIQSDTQSECCTIVSKYNLVPFVSWGTTPTSKQSWWDANMCNDLVGGCSRSRCSGVTKEASCSSTAGKACAGQMCFNDPSCKNGGLGCNAAGMGECRFCGFGAYAGIECPVQSDFEVHH